jgi:hypothetical protein
MTQGELELIHYETPECQADFTLDALNDTVWASQQQIADVFEKDVNTIGGHLKNIFETGELSRVATTRNFRVVRTEGDRSVAREIEHYNLDAILSVGYRVNSVRATAFRQWATHTLRNYLTQGFVINEARLQDDPSALRELAAKVRALRANEQNIYQAVRDVFAFGSVDYAAKSPAAHSFFARLQDKFLVAITGKTASELKLERADHTKDNMGLQKMRGDRPKRADIDIGKNYLAKDELYELHILCEQFLLFVESRAIRGHELTMNAMSVKFDELIAVQGHQVFAGYKDVLYQRAKTHAHREFDLYTERMISEAQEVNALPAANSPSTVG